MAKKKTPTLAQLDPEILMLGYLCVKGIDNLQAEVGILDRFGLKDQEIAAITGRNQRSIKDARYEAKRKK